MRLDEATLLLVEDDPFTQEQLGLFLEREVRRLYQAYDAEEGLELFLRHRPDIVLTDLNMPHGGGMEMIRQIRRAVPRQPVLILSAHDNRETLLESLNLAVDGFIPKPILSIDRIREKLESIARHLEGSESDASDSGTFLDQKSLEELYRKAHSDPLTGIRNRHYFHERFEQLFANEGPHEPVALLYIDLDNLKILNDRFGHEAGDRALIHLARYLEDRLPVGGTLARIGGDEFAMVLPGFDEKRLKELIDAIQKETAEGLPIPGSEEIRLGFSIGCSLYPQDARSGEELLRHADRAMYQAKHSGKGCCFFYHQKEDDQESSHYRFSR